MYRFRASHGLLQGLFKTDIFSSILIQQVAHAKKVTCGGIILLPLFRNPFESCQQARPDIRR
jgi:hypothetical protein